MKTLRSIGKRVFVSLLTIEARLVLRKYKPHIITITGSVGKTSTKDATYAILSRHRFARKSEKSFNSEIGVPLTILGAANAWNDLVRWMRVFAEGIGLILLPNHYPRWLVLEVGADRPGDIKNLARWIRCDVVIITRFPDVPVHVEFFKTSDEVAAEKQHLIKSLSPEGTLILNADDDSVLGSAALYHGNILTYGFAEGAHVRASHVSTLYVGDIPAGMSFRIEYKGNSVPCELRGALGKSHISAALAAAAAGIAIGINLVDVAQDLRSHETPPGRMRILPGRNGSTLIDDTYNSSPAAAHSALTALDGIEIKGGKKIAILADMLELGSHSVSEHQSLGKEVAEVADELYAVGVRARDIAQSALRSGMDAAHVHEFSDWKDALLHLPKLSQNDIVLIKGSQSTRLEKVTAALLSPDENPNEVLVRQEAEWQKR